MSSASHLKRKMKTKTSKSGERQYEVDGEWYSSVTTILSIIRKPGLEWWFKNNTKEETDEIGNIAKAVGQSVHAAIEYELKEEAYSLEDNTQQVFKSYGVELLDEYYTQVTNAFSGFANWYEDTDFKPQLIEEFVHNKQYKYAGTLDAIGKVGDEVVLLDFKTSKRMQPDYGLQLSAYAHAYTSTGNLPPNKLLVVRLDKLSDEGYYQEKEYKDEFDVFLNAVELYNWSKS